MARKGIFFPLKDAALRDEMRGFFGDGRVPVGVL